MEPALTGLGVCWLTPDKPDSISVGRQRVAAHLEEMGADVTLRGTTPRTVARTFRDRDGYDVFLGTTRAGAIAAVGLGHLTGVPVVVDHIDPIRQFATTSPRWLSLTVKHLENLSFRLATHVLYVYQEEAHRVRFRANAATKTDLGVEVDHFAPSAESRDKGVDRLRNAGVRGKVAIYVGGLEPIYHVRELLEAVGFLDDWTLVFVGTGSERPLVEAAAHRHDDIVYLGTMPHDDVPALLHAANVGISLVDDPHTLKVLEYGAAGLPVVQLSGRAEDRFGDRVEYCEAEPQSVAAAIERAAARPGEELREFVARFDWQRIAETYASVVADVSQGSNTVG